MTERKWLTAPEMAKATGLSRQMITQLCRLQKLPSHKIQGRWLINWGLMTAAMGLTGPHWGPKLLKSEASPPMKGSDVTPPWAWSDAEIDEQIKQSGWERDQEDQRQFWIDHLGKKRK